MSLALIGALAVLTYGSRALALVFMPHPPERARIVLDRIPAPLFAALAVTSLIEDGKLAGAETLCAVAGALIVTPTRSLLWVLVGGVAGYALGALLFG
jgi:branched-subunit amino acid transport protein